MENENIRKIVNLPEKVGMGLGGLGVAFAMFYPPAMILLVPATELFVVSAVSHEVTGSFFPDESE